MRKSHLTWSILAVILAAIVGGAISVAEGPDFEIELDRKIPSNLSPEYLDKAVQLIRQWPAWYFACVGADQVNANGIPLPETEQKLEKGAFIRLREDTKRRLHGEYSVTLQVVDYVPEMLRMRVIADSKNNLTRLFDPLEWTVQFVPREKGSWILGKATARTHHWRARLFGKLMPKILLNQVYYPNLFILAEINNPDVVAPQPEEQHSGM